MSDRPGWLPDIVSIDTYGGDWNKYLGVIYKIFKNDFIKTQPVYERKKVYAITRPIIEGKEWGFWHIISEGNVEDDRTPDFRRCERINWLKPIIKNSSFPEILIWIAKRKRRGGHSNRRVHIWLKDFNYIIVLSVRKNHYLLITAFFTDRDHTRRKLLRECESYKGRCRP